MTDMTTNAHSRTSRLPNVAEPLRVGPASHDRTHRRRIATAWIGGGALWAIAGLLYSGAGWRFRASSAVFLATDLLLVAAIIGLLWLRPHSSSRPAAASLGVALVARVVFALAEVSGLVTGTDNTVLLPIAGLLTGLSSIAYGMLARAADRRLRIATAAMGLYFFVAMMPFAIATGEPPALALAAWGLPIVFVGVTLDRSNAVRHATFGPVP